MASDVFEVITPNHKDSGSVDGSGQKLRRFSVKEVGFFEGPEKLLEVWFDLKDDTIRCADHSEYNKGLRIFPRYTLDTHTLPWYNTR